MLAVDDLDFDLPTEAIATTPAEPRESAKLMVVSRQSGEILEHTSVAKLAKFIRAGDLLIVNSTRVLQARLEGSRADTGGSVEGLYLQPATSDDGSRMWLCLLSGKRVKEEMFVDLRTRDGAVAPIRLQLLHRVEAKSGAWKVRVLPAHSEGEALLRERDEMVLEAIGHTPLPPYIRTARKRANEAEERASDRARYQTTFAPSFAPAFAEGGHGATSQQLGSASEKVGLLHTGSVAAPTAGLHVTPGVLAEIASRGAHVEQVVLHVGLGTFAPVQAEFLQQHPMHEERCSMSAGVRERILATRAAGGRVICVGTTSVRTVESYAAMWAAHAESPAHLDTKLLIAPGYAFNWTDCLLTNFHTPRSTLLALVSTMFGSAGALRAGEPLSGLAKLKELYATALREKYRFFSYGDAMLLVRE